MRTSYLSPTEQVIVLTWAAAFGLSFLWFIFGLAALASLFFLLEYFRQIGFSRILLYAGFLVLPAFAGGLHRSWKVAGLISLWETAIMPYLVFSLGFFPPKC